MAYVNHKNPETSYEEIIVVASSPLFFASPFISSTEEAKNLFASIAVFSKPAIIIMGQIS